MASSRTKKSNRQFNVLAYVEPIVELEWPDWKLPWCTYAHSFIDTLGKSGILKSSRILVNKYLSKQTAKIFSDTKTVVITIEQEDLLIPFSSNYLSATTTWYDGSYKNEQLDYVAKALENRIGSFKPDVILTFTPVPFLAALYPKAVVLHMEVGAFSRPPYGPSYYLDPSGMFKDSSLVKFKKQIESYRPSSREIKTIDTFREKSLGALRKTHPQINGIMMKWRKKFANIILLPLQFSNYYAFDANCNFKNQLEYLSYVMDNTPSDIGVVVTQHPQHACITEELSRELAGKYKNIILSKDFLYGTFASQYILPYVDGVVSVSSSVAVQALLFSKKLFVLGRSHLTSLGDSLILTNMPSVLKARVTNKNKWLSWMLGRYYIRHTELTNPAFLSGYVEKAYLYKGKSKLDRFYTNLHDNNKSSTYAQGFIDDISTEYQSPHKNVFNTQEFRAWTIGVESKAEEIRGKDEHIKNIEETFKEQAAHIANLELAIEEKDAHVKNIEEIIKEQTTHIANLEPILKEKDAHIRNIEAATKEQTAHIKNLEVFLRDKDTYISNLEPTLNEKNKYIASLEPILKEKDAHIKNIEAAIKEATARIASLEPILKEKKAHIANLEPIIKEQVHYLTNELNIHINNLEALLKERNEQIDYLGIDLRNKSALVDDLEAIINDKEATIAQYQDSLKEADVALGGLKIALAAANEHARGLEINIADNKQKIAGLNDGIQIRDKHIANLTDELTRYRQHAGNLEGKVGYQQNYISELEDNLYNSLGGKVILFYRNLKNKLAPQSTWRRSFYEWWLRRIKGLFRTGEKEYYQGSSDVVTRFRRLKDLMMPAGSLRRAVYEKILRLIKSLFRMGAKQPMGETVLIKYRLVRDKLFPRSSWRRVIYTLITEIIKAPFSVLLIVTIWIVMGLRKITPNWLTRDLSKKEELRYVTSLKKVTHYNRNEVEAVNASVSIAIPTFNAGESFSTTLALWKNQKGVKKLNIRIVDSGSKDNTVRYAREIGADIEIIDSKDFHHAKVRNKMAGKSASEYVLFTVQDATPQNQFLIYDLVNFARQDKLIAASVRQVPRLNIDLFSGWQQAHHINWLFPKVESRVSKITPEQFKGLPPDKQRFLASLDDVCALVKRDAFLEIGSYNDAIFFGEDIDFGKRCMEKGRQIGLLYENGVIHSHVRPAHYFLKRGVVDTFYVNKIFGTCRDKPADMKELSLFVSQAELLYSSVINHFRHCQSYARFCSLLQELTPSKLAYDDETTEMVRSLCRKFVVVSTPVSQNELLMFAGLVRDVTKYLAVHSAQMSENPAAVQEFMRKFAAMYIGQRVAQYLDANTTNEKIVDLVGGGV